MWTNGAEIFFIKFGKVWFREAGVLKFCIGITVGGRFVINMWFQICMLQVHETLRTLIVRKVLMVLIFDHCWCLGWIDVIMFWIKYFFQTALIFPFKS